MQIVRQAMRAIPILLLSLVNSSCVQSSSLRRHCASVGYEFFYDIAAAQREFTKLPIEKKYDVLICASQGTHPPRLEFASLFAAEGERGAALLRENLLETTDDLTVRDIGYALLKMQELRTYNVVADAELMTLLELRVNGMKNEDWRKLAKENLKRMRAH